MIGEKGHTPYLNGAAMVKYFMYGSDDEEIYALKECFANNPTVHSHPHYTLKKYAFYNKICILRIISSFL